MANKNATFIYNICRSYIMKMVVLSIPQEHQT